MQYHAITLSEHFTPFFFFFLFLVATFLVKNKLKLTCQNYWIWEANIIQNWVDTNKWQQQECALWGTTQGTFAFYLWNMYLPLQITVELAVVLLHGSHWVLGTHRLFATLCICPNTSNLLCIWEFFWKLSLLPSTRRSRDGACEMVETILFSHTQPIVNEMSHKYLVCP